MRGIARREIEGEKRILEEKIASLYQELTQNNAEKEMLMSQLYSRYNYIKVNRTGMKMKKSIYHENCSSNNDKHKPRTLSY